MNLNNSLYLFMIIFLSQAQKKGLAKHCQRMNITILFTLLSVIYGNFRQKKGSPTQGEKNDTARTS